MIRKQIGAQKINATFPRTALLFGMTALLAVPVQSGEARAAQADAGPVAKAAGRSAQTKAPAHPSRTQETASSMLGATSPTDERIEVTGHNYGNSVTRRAFGGGLMIPSDSLKSVSAITRASIAKQNPALNPMQLIALLPGANVADTDPLGMTGDNMSVCGLTASRTGFTLEGFPIDDIGDFAVYPQDIVDAENLKTVPLAQGFADLDNPHISTSGGVVDMYMIDPKSKMGGMVDMTSGSFNSTRGFLRFDTGRIGATNLRSYFS